MYNVKDQIQLIKYTRRFLFTTIILISAIYTIIVTDNTNYAIHKAH